MEFFLQHRVTNVSELDHSLIQFFVYFLQLIDRFFTVLSRLAVLDSLNELERFLVKVVKVSLGLQLDWRFGDLLQVNGQLDALVLT